jgi:hypothetical protein
MSYSIEEHKQRLAVWAAASAAMTSPLCRFTVEKEKAILEGLAAENVGHHAVDWKRFAAWRWSKLNSSLYQEIIDLIRACQGAEALWKIEEHWIGYR